MRRYRVLLFIALVCGTLVHCGTANAQEDRVVYPPEIYCGENTITISLPSGIQRVEVGDATPNITVFGAGKVDCRQKYGIRVLVTDPLRGSVQLVVTDCRNRTFVRTLNSRSWNVDINRLGRVQLGDTACHEFQIRTDANDPTLGTTVVAQPTILDSITVNDPRIIVRLPGKLPVTVRPGETYRYKVCVVATELGRMKYPVTTWIRRTYPSGGLTTYAVADTGLVTVVAPPEQHDTLPVRTPERPPDQPPPAPEPPITDPTTFRSIAVPNAILPKKGHGYVGSYDVLGLTAGYSLHKNVMLLAGGALPTPDDWTGIHGDMFGAYSIGLKAGLPIGDRFNVAAGYQWGRSFYDKQNPVADTVRSDITISAPYAALSYGDDDSRLSLTAGYAFKHHKKPNVEFDQNAAFFAVGGDIRVARHWKLAGELLRMETVGVVPLVATARYFGESFAIDAGVAYVGITTGDTKTPSIPVVPVVSAILVF
ncbi:MAG: hypothetical protein JST22_06980 [Bacteroidetes bacterium]|nr:hypothetical protein [Bacteroidota bacterium]